jgi:hypothetical protein
MLCACSHDLASSKDQVEGSAAEGRLKDQSRNKPRTTSKRKVLTSLGCAAEDLCISKASCNEDGSSGNIESDHFERVVCSYV